MYVKLLNETTFLSGLMYSLLKFWEKRLNSKDTSIKALYIV